MTLVNPALGARDSPEFSHWSGEEGEEEGGGEVLFAKVSIFGRQV